MEEMPLEVRAIYANTATLPVARQGEPLRAAQLLERIGDDGVDHILLWDQCLTYYSFAEQLDPELPIAHRERVVAKALRADPQDPVALGQRAVVLLQQGHTREGMSMLYDLLPEQGQLERMFTHSLLAEACLERGDREGAARHAALSEGKGRLRTALARRGHRRQLSATAAESSAHEDD